MEKWTGEVALVTGASSGIGRSIALKLADHGLNVAVLARREDRLKELCEKFNGKGSIKAYKCDVSKSSELEEVLKQVETDLGRIRVLVNNAGIAISAKITEFDIDSWRRMFDVNLFAMFTCIKKVVHSAINNNDEKPIHIININSIAGHQDPPSLDAFVYSATKHCVSKLTRAVQTQLAISKHKNIKLTSISPGVVDTEIFEMGGWDKFDMNAAAHLIPDDIANGVITVLSSPQNVLELSSGYSGKGTIVGFECDVTDSAKVEEVFVRIASELGPVRVLVNNAGIGIGSKFSDFEIFKWRKMMEVNVFGCFECTKHVINAVKQSGTQDLVQIINVNSIAGQTIFETCTDFYPYSASKHCLTLLTKALMKQMVLDKLNVRVTSIHPGVVKTEFLEANDFFEDMITGWPALEAEDVVQACIATLEMAPHALITTLTVKPMGEII